ncbi:MAG: GNAT family N-acetyltransferase [Saprospiraceae bacterium]|nr:GNAT family N-acetyltransferase [Saprospiraceae bacterium]
MMEIIYKVANSNTELQEILVLQKENLRKTKSAEEEAKEGFVTVCHDLELLQEMNEKAGHVIGLHQGRVVAYALTMTKDFKNKIPVLVPMFEMIDNLVFQNQRIGDYTYLVMGQVCIEKNFRGKGIFNELYQTYFKHYKGNYDFIITEIAARNTRSLKAHLNIGFQIIHEYHETGMEDWVVVGY